MKSRRLLGIRLLSGFFTFGATMCALTLVLLLAPGTPLDWLWRLNPAAHESFQSIGSGAVVLMATVGTACGFAAVGLWRGKRWAMLLAIVILAVNVAGDVLNAVLRHDYRALIGVPIGGAMILYLLRAKHES